MSTDVAPPLFLPQEDPAYRGGAPLRPEPAPGESKKRVSFADHRGLPLARVKVFSQFKDAIRVPVGPRPAPADRVEDEELVLDFGRPAHDYVLFRRTPDGECVSLETCALKGRTLTGTVKVKNLSFQKRVRLRVTFDSWASHRDVECAYVEDAYPGGACGDTFSFSLALPAPEPGRGVEFAVCYQAAGAEYWDSNRGRNYRVVRARDRRRGDGQRPFRRDAWGGLACARGIAPDWPGYAGYENLGPYY